MLLEPNVLDYDTLIVCGNSLHQPEYKIMNAAFAKNLSKDQMISESLQTKFDRIFCK